MPHNKPHQPHSPKPQLMPNTTVSSRVLSICLLSASVGLATHATDAHAHHTKKSNANYTKVKRVMHGKASYYAHRFHGRLTANGERFNMHAMTAAHKKLKFGTRVRVTNKTNGKSVIVRINDRGPYIHGRSIDLSYAAGKKIGMMKSGVARVKMEILQK